MAKIQSGTDAYFLVDGVPKQRGKYEVVTTISNGVELLGIKVVGKNSYIVNCGLKPVNSYTNNADAPIASLLAFFAYIQPFFFATAGTNIANQSSWLEPAIAIATSPVGSPVIGGRYLILGTGTGGFAGQDNKVATWNGATYDYYTPVSGDVIQVIGGAQYTFNGTVWGTSNVANALLQKGNSFGSSVRAGSANNQNVDIIANGLMVARFIAATRNVNFPNTIVDNAFEWSRSLSRLTVRGNSDTTGTAFSVGGLSGNAYVFGNATATFNRLISIVSDTQLGTLDTNNINVNANSSLLRLRYLGNIVYDFLGSQAVLNRTTSITTDNINGTLQTNNSNANVNVSLLKAQHIGVNTYDFRANGFVHLPAAISIGFTGLQSVGFSYRGNTNAVAALIAQFQRLDGGLILGMKAGGTINTPNMPTSATGLVAGDWWRDGKTLRIV